MTPRLSETSRCMLEARRAAFPSMLFTLCTASCGQVCSICKNKRKRNMTKNELETSAGPCSFRAVPAIIFRLLVCKLPPLNVAPSTACRAHQSTVTAFNSLQLNCELKITLTNNFERLSYFKNVKFICSFCFLIWSSKCFENVFGGSEIYLLRNVSFGYRVLPKRLSKSFVTF